MRDAIFEAEGLSVPEAAHVSGIGPTRLYEAIGAGELTARKYGKRTIILRDDLRRFLVSLPAIRGATTR
jgi:Helix-turn-helix domain